MILVLGPSGSGKTTLVKILTAVQKQLKSRTDILENSELPSVQPTVGTNITSLVYSRKIIEVREVGGCMVPIWKSYYQDANAIIFVVDSSNPLQISSACVLLHQVLSSTPSIPLLVLFNKIDIPSKTTVNEFKYLLQLNLIIKNSSQPIAVLDISCKDKTAINDVSQWILAKQ